MMSGKKLFFIAGQGEVKGTREQPPYAMLKATKGVNDIEV